MQQKALLLFVGDCFRDGYQNSTLKDTPFGHHSQMEACDTHVKFIKHLESMDICIDVRISTYKTIFKTELESKYGHILKNVIYNKHKIGLKGLINQITYDNDSYLFIYIIRIDLYLKDQFIY